MVCVHVCLMYVRFSASSVPSAPTRHSLHYRRSLDSVPPPQNHCYTYIFLVTNGQALLTGGLGGPEDNPGKQRTPHSLTTSLPGAPPQTTSWNADLHGPHVQWGSGQQGCGKLFSPLWVSFPIWKKKDDNNEVLRLFKPLLCSHQINKQTNKQKKKSGWTRKSSTPTESRRAEGACAQVGHQHRSTYHTGSWHEVRFFTSLSTSGGPHSPPLFLLT